MLARPFFWSVLLLTLFIGSAARGQLPPGKDGYAFPAGGKAGTTLPITLGGTDWTPDVQFFVHDPRVKLEILSSPGDVLVPEPPFWFGIKSFANDPRLPREVSARIHLPADIPPGPVRWSVANANGANTGGVFVVGTGEEVTENERRAGPQTLSHLPVTINGRLERIEEIDRYTFRAVTDGLVTADLTLRRLGHDFHGVIEVADERKSIAEAVDTGGTDPILTFEVKQGHEYTVAVRDLEHRGYRNLTYRLHLAPGPRVRTAFPPTGQRGETRAIEFVGVGIASGRARVERLTKPVTFPASTGRDTFDYRFDTPFGQATYTFLLDDLPNPPDPLQVSLPFGLAGRFTRRGERATYSIVGKKGDIWNIAVQARSVGSSVDATLTVLGPDGKVLVQNDDFGSDPDPRATITLPAEGEYRVVVRDVSGIDSGPEAVYRLIVRQPVSRFTLRAGGTVNVPIGGKATLPVDVIREGTFTGPIVLTVTGLPAGVTVPENLVVGPGVCSWPVPLECAKTAAAGAGFVRVTGTATIEGRPVVVSAATAPEGESDPGTLVATTLKPPFKVNVAEADGGRRIPRGSTHLAEILVNRSDGFTGEILLDMAAAQQRHRQGICGPTVLVTPDRTRVDYPVFLPEWLETTRTSRIGLVAMALVPDPTGVPRYVADAVQGQVTMSIEGALMKLSYGPAEVTVRCGESVEVPLKLARVTQISDPVRVELVIPEALAGLVSAEPFEWPGEKSSAPIRIRTRNDPRLVGTWTLTARATGTRNGYPVVSQIPVEIEFTSPVPRKPIKK